MFRIGICLCLALIWTALCGFSTAEAQEKPTAAYKEIEDTRIVDAKLFRGQRELIINPQSTAAHGVVEIPRFYASLKSLAWVVRRQTSGDGLTLKPEPDHWQISWKDRPEGATAIRLLFDVQPLLEKENRVVRPRGDGSFKCYAHQADTSGEKVRYEPQWYKNTVGYWAGADDQATWRLRVPEAGNFNVGILQGCGAGHGGSQAIMELLDGQRVVATVEFDVLETGHFQNFQWRQVGQLEIKEAGNYTLRVRPRHIQKAALMDLREVHLVRLPADD